MATPLSILIVDADRYFSYGLRLGLQSFFQAHQQDIHLIEKTQIESRIDIIFLGDLVSSSPWLYWLHQRNHRPLVFFIKEPVHNKNTLKSRLKCEKCQANTFYRHQSLFALYELLDSALFSPPLSPLTSSHSCTCLSPLTLREKEVLWCIRRGMNGRDTGEYLQISNKTANAHKQSAMRKLNFRSNQELYRWLLKGGGDYLNERSLATRQIWPSQPTMPAENRSLLPTQSMGRQTNHAYSSPPIQKQTEPLDQTEPIVT